MENYKTINNKLKLSGVDPESVDVDRITADLQTQGVAPIGYQPVEGGKDLPLYDNSEALDGALERCGVNAPKKEIESAVEAKKGKSRKIEKGEEAIEETSA